MAERCIQPPDRTLKIIHHHFGAEPTDFTIQVNWDDHIYQIQALIAQKIEQLIELEYGRDMPTLSIDHLYLHNGVRPLTHQWWTTDAQTEPFQIPPELRVEVDEESGEQFLALVSRFSMDSLWSDSRGQFLESETVHLYLLPEVADYLRDRFGEAGINEDVQSVVLRRYWPSATLTPALPDTATTELLLFGQQWSKLKRILNRVESRECVFYLKHAQVNVDAPTPSKATATRSGGEAGGGEADGEADGLDEEEPDEDELMISEDFQINLTNIYRNLRTSMQMPYFRINLPKIQQQKAYQPVFKSHPGETQTWMEVGAKDARGLVIRYLMTTDDSGEVPRPLYLTLFLKLDGSYQITLDWKEHLKATQNDLEQALEKGTELIQTLNRIPFQPLGFRQIMLRLPQLGSDGVQLQDLAAYTPLAGSMDLKMARRVLGQSLSSFWIRQPFRMGINRNQLTFTRRENLELQLLYKRAPSFVSYAHFESFLEQEVKLGEQSVPLVQILDLSNEETLEGLKQLWGISRDQIQRWLIQYGAEGRRPTFRYNNLEGLLNLIRFDQGVILKLEGGGVRQFQLTSQQGTSLEQLSQLHDLVWRALRVDESMLAAAQDQEDEVEFEAGDEELSALFRQMGEDIATGGDGEGADRPIVDPEFATYNSLDEMWEAYQTLPAFNMKSAEQLTPNDRLSALTYYYPKVGRDVDIGFGFAEGHHYTSSCQSSSQPVVMTIPRAVLMGRIVQQTLIELSARGITGPELEEWQELQKIMSAGRFYSLSANINKEQAFFLRPEEAPEDGVYLACFKYYDWDEDRPLTRMEAIDRQARGGRVFIRKESKIMSIYWTRGVGKPHRPCCAKSEAYQQLTYPLKDNVRGSDYLPENSTHIMWGKMQMGCLKDLFQVPAKLGGDKAVARSRSADARYVRMTVAVPADPDPESGSVASFLDAIQVALIQRGIQNLGSGGHTAHQRILQYFMEEEDDRGYERYKTRHNRMWPILFPDHTTGDGEILPRTGYADFLDYLRNNPDQLDERWIWDLIPEGVFSPPMNLLLLERESPRKEHRRIRNNAASRRCADEYDLVIPAGYRFEDLFQIGRPTLTLLRVSTQYQVVLFEHGGTINNAFPLDSLNESESHQATQKLLTIFEAIRLNQSRVDPAVIRQMLRTQLNQDRLAPVGYYPPSTADRLFEIISKSYSIDYQVVDRVGFAYRLGVQISPGVHLELPVEASPLIRELETRDSLGEPHTLFDIVKMLHQIMQRHYTRGYRPAFIVYQTEDSIAAEGGAEDQTEGGAEGGFEGEVDRALEPTSDQFKIVGIELSCRLVIPCQPFVLEDDRLPEVQRLNLPFKEILYDPSELRVLDELIARPPEKGAQTQKIGELLFEQESYQRLRYEISKYLQVHPVILGRIKEIVSSDAKVLRTREELVAARTTLEEVLARIVDELVYFASEHPTERTREFLKTYYPPSYRVSCFNHEITPDNKHHCVNPSGRARNGKLFIYTQNLITGSDNRSRYISLLADELLRAHFLRNELLEDGVDNVLMREDVEYPDTLTTEVNIENKKLARRLKQQMFDQEAEVYLRRIPGMVPARSAVIRMEAEAEAESVQNEESFETGALTPITKETKPKLYQVLGPHRSCYRTIGTHGRPNQFNFEVLANQFSNFHEDPISVLILKELLISTLKTMDPIELPKSSSDPETVQVPGWKVQLFYYKRVTSLYPMGEGNYLNIHTQGDLENSIRSVHHPLTVADLAILSRAMDVKFLIIPENPYQKFLDLGTTQTTSNVHMLISLQASHATANLGELAGGDDDAPTGIKIASRESLEVVVNTCADPLISFFSSIPPQIARPHIHTARFRDSYRSKVDSSNGYLKFYTSRMTAEDVLDPFPLLDTIPGARVEKPAAAPPMAPPPPRMAPPMAPPMAPAPPAAPPGIPSTIEQSSEAPMAPPVPKPVPALKPPVIPQPPVIKPPGFLPAPPIAPPPIIPPPVIPPK